MRPYYVEVYDRNKSKDTNRKIAQCPICGREEVISKERELVKCSICAMKMETKKEVSNE